NTGTGWSHHNYFTPGGWKMDVGEDQRFVPTGFDITMASGNSRWTDFDLEASVDGEIWDPLWEQRIDEHGFISTAGEEILFDDVPFLQLKNVENGGVFGLGTAFVLQTELYNMDVVTGVEYFANGVSIGSATAGPDYDISWTPTELGVYTLTAVATYASGAKSQAVWFPVTLTIQPASVLDRIDISPEDIRVYPGAQVQMTAEAFDQYNIPLDPQPAFAWSVANGGGTVDAAGLYTAGSEFGEFDISVSATYEGDTLTANQSVIVVDAGNFCVEYFAGELLRPVWSFISKESWPGARADVDHGRVTIQSRGASMWQSTQEFSAIRRTDITGDFDVSVKVISQNENYTDDGSKVGIVVANNFNDLSQGGYLTLHTRGNGRVAFQREGAPGEISSSTIDTFPEGKDWPVWLRLVKSGTEFSTYYKFAEADEWEHLGTSTVGAAAIDSQVALFASSNNTSKTVYGVFGDFIIADCDPGDFVLIPAAPEIVQQPQPVSVFEGGSITLTAEATGFPVITGYQWLKDGVEISNDHRISGAESAQLVIEDAQFSDQGAYTLAVTNDEGTTTTDEALVEVLPTPALYLLIDFGTNHTDPGDLWNSLNDGDTHTDLINSIDGEETSVEIDIITTSGSGIQTSGNNTAWGTRYIAPDWANSEALNDRLWVDQGHTATLRFRNLDPAKTYSLEIASGFGGSGSNGNEPGLFEVVGAGDAVEGFNAFNDDSLGTQVHWTSRGPTDGGNAPYAVEGWMIWKDVSPNSEGHIDVLLSTVSNSTARVSLNAARLIEMPEPEEQGPDIEGNPEGASLDAGESHTFSVLASGSGTLSYQWFKDGVEIEDATDASLIIDPAGVGDSGNYTVQVTDDNGSTMSDPAVLEVSGIALTLHTSPSASEITYGQSLSEAVLSGGEVRNPSDEVVAGTFAFVEGAYEPAAGTESHAVWFSPENDFLYEPLTFDLSVTVNPAEATLFFSDLSQSYNATGRSPSVSTDPGGLAVNITFDGSGEAPVTVGEYPFAAEIADPNFVGSDSGTLAITVAPLEVTADDQLKGLDEPDPELTWSLTGGELFGGDVVSGELTREAGETTGTYAIQQGTLTAGANYDLSFVAGTLTIVEVLEYTLSYHANGGIGPVPDLVTGDAGTQVGVSFEPAPTRDGFTFLGWKTDAGGVLADFPEGEAATVALEEDVTLYAHWLSPWVLHENFEELGLGDIDGQGGWSAQTHSLVVEDPLDSANRAFSFRPGGSNNSASKALSEPVEDGDSVTFFFRFNIPQASSSFNQQIRFGNIDVFRVAFNGSHDSVFSIFYDGMGGGSSNVGIDQNIDRDTWYKVWVILNGTTSRYEIYIEGGEYDTPTRVTTADDDTAKYSYAERDNNTISSLEFIGWGGFAVLFDDFYLFPGGMSLDDPRPQDMAGSFDSWLEEASVPEGERGPFDSPARDGIANLLKYALGLDPMVPSNQLFASLEEPGLPWVVNDREVGEFRFYYRMDHSLSDITYHPQWSNDLVEWHDGGDFTEHSAGQEGDIEMREVRFSTEGEDKAFFRLQIRREE
ncbi:MAG: immunoglobulin domain-containing protein, partial [Opitutales bacterium]|nr:immunoglobulin domain-containing protein [Opitutales bacterium]